MATRRKIGATAMSTEAARRTQHWTKQLAPGYKFQVYTWTKSDMSQEFSDNEDEVEESLAPLPYEAEAGEGDEEMDQDEAETISVVPQASQPDATDITTIQDEALSKPPSPQPQLSMSLQTSSQLDLPLGTLDASLNPLDTDMADLADLADIDVGVGLVEKDGLVELDMTGLGPDGLGLENSHDLSQLEDTDILIGGPMMSPDDDPFAQPVDG